METMETPKYINQWLYTDVRPFEVLRQISATKLLVRRMKAELEEESRKKLNDSFIQGGFAGHFDNSLQEWIITPDPSATPFEVRRRKDGFYYQAGDCLPFKPSDRPVYIYDYNF